jgi:TonB family protein
MIEAIIGRDGNVRETRVIRSAHPLLDEEALKAVRLWVYKPATWKGRPVSVYLTVTTTFSLN